VAIQPERRVAIQVGRARHVQSSGKNVEFQRTSRATVLVSPRSVVQQSPSPPQKLSPPSQKLSPRREAGSHRLVFQQQRTSPRQLEPLSGGGTSSEDDRLSPPPMLHQRRSSLGKLRAAIEVVELAAPPPVEVEVDASANGGDGGGPSDEPASSSAEPAAALPVASWVADDLAPPRQTRRRSTTTQRQAIRARWRHALELYREVARQARAQELEAAKVVARKEYRHAKARADKLWRENEFDECLTHLDKTLRLKESDVLRRYRSRCQVHRAKAFDAGTEAEGMHGGGQGRRLANRRDDEAAVIHASALRDARHAARLNPKASDNQFMLGRSLERTARSHPGHLGPSAAAYIESMALGQSEAVADAYAAVPEEAAPDDDTFPRGPYRDSPVSRVSNGVEGRFAFVLGAVRRHRDYPALGVHEQYPHLPNAPNVRHGGGGGGAASFGVTAGAARPGQHHALPSFGKQHGSWSMGRKHASIFDPRKRLAESGDTAKIQVGPPGLPPAPRLLLPRGGEEGDEFVHRPDESGDPSKAGRYEATVTWDEPEDDGGDEIYQYSLQLSRYDVKWEPALGDLFDGFRPWETVHEGPAKVMSHRLAELLPNNTYKVRVSCLNSVGSSEWSEPYLSFDSPSVETEGGGQVASRPAKSWLRVPMPEVLLEHTKLVLEGSTADDFMVELAEALQVVVPPSLPPCARLSDVAPPLSSRDLLGGAPPQPLTLSPHPRAPTACRPDRSQTCSSSRPSSRCTRRAPPPTCPEAPRSTARSLAASRATSASPRASTR